MSEQRVLLPNVDEVLGEGLRRMNVIMKLNNEQIFALLSSFSSEGDKIRVVVKEGKIAGLRRVEEGSGKVEIVKCNVVKESTGVIYHMIEGGEKAVNLGMLDYRLNLINYKPRKIESEDVRNVKRFEMIVRVLNVVKEHVVKEGKEGVMFEIDGVLGEFRGEEREVKEVLKKVTSGGGGGGDVIEWKWFKLVRSFESREWIKQLLIEGYRPNDAYMMLYSGKVSEDLQRGKEKEKEKVREDAAVYSDSGSSKSSVGSLSSQFSRVGENSRDTSPEREVKRRKVDKREDAVGKVAEYKRKYVEYFEMYDKLRRWDERKGGDVNEGIAKLLRMHNELEDIKADVKRIRDVLINK